MLVCQVFVYPGAGNERFMKCNTDQMNELVCVRVCQMRMRMLEEG